jgi:hypothetical protein
MTNPYAGTDSETAWDEGYSAGQYEPYGLPSPPMVLVEPYDQVWLEGFAAGQAAVLVEPSQDAEPAPTEQPSPESTLSPETEAVLAAGRLRISTTVELGMVPDHVPGADEDYNYYFELRRYLKEHIEAQDAGATGDAWVIDSWSQTLKQTGSYRSLLSGHAANHHGRQAEQAAERLRSLDGALAKELKSLDRVKAAIRDAEKVSEITETLLQLNEISEAIREPNLENLVGLLPVPDKEDVIEEGIAMLGRYTVALELAASGYGSVEELQGAIRSTVAAAYEARTAIQYALGQRDAALQLGEVPAME